MPIPLYGFLEGDTIGLLVLSEEAESVTELARKLQQAASIRVAPIDAVEVVYDGKTLDPNVTVAQAGLQALDRFDVVRRREP
jgi:Toluene-4-monooxygenase system protein B (TmoB)